jgi:hypothetical protein
MKKLKQIINKHTFLQLVNQSIFVIEKETNLKETNETMQKRCFKNFLKHNFSALKVLKFVYPVKIKSFEDATNLFVFLKVESNIKKIFYLRLFSFVFLKNFLFSTLFSKQKIFNNLKLVLQRLNTVEFLVKK